MKKESSKHTLICMGLALILSANLFFFVPFDIYLANSDEFITPFWNIMGWISIPALMFMVILILIASSLKKEPSQRYAVLLAVSGILVWLQSDVLLWDYGLLSGETIDWSRGYWRGWLDLGIWIGAVYVSLRHHDRFGKIILQFALAIFCIQLLMTVYSTSTNWNRFSSALNQEEEALDQYYRFSSTHNIFHILLDGFQSDIFEDIIEHPEIGDQVKSSLDGFVFYKETLGVFPYTRFALPALLSGKIYRNQQTKDEFVDSVFRGKTIFNTAYDNGYEVDLAGDEYWAVRYAMGHHNNSVVIPKTGFGVAANFEWTNSSRLFDLTLFKAVPHFVKILVYNNQSWLTQSLFFDPRSSFRYFSHTNFMKELIQNMVVEREAPVYKYMHVMNTHNPMVVNPDCSFAGGAIRTTRQSLTAQSICTLDTVLQLFGKMKELGIYENSLIIVHADHGGWVKTREFREQVLADGTELHPSMMSLATPLLAIKLPNAKGKLETSSALASLPDIPDSISDIMGWNVDFNHRSVLDLVPGQDRSRSYYFYYWQRDAWEAEHTGPIQEFTFEGSHFNADWNPGRTFYPPEK